MIGRGIALAVALALILAGCGDSQKPLIIQKGGFKIDGAQYYLISLSVEDPQKIPNDCQHGGSLGCTIPIFLDRPDGKITVIFQTLGRNPSTPDQVYELFAHEQCHAISAANRLKVDPCHNEDGGALRL